MTQGAIFPMCKAAARENQSTNMRFNEIFLCFRVEVDEVAAQSGATMSTDFGKTFELLLDDESVRSSRVRVEKQEDMVKLNYKKLI